MSKLVSSWNEWDSLERVIVGRPEGTNIPAPEPAWWHDHPQGGFPLGQWGPFPQEMVDAALKEISDIATVTVKEAQLEDLIKAKGFADCVVYISDNVNITVPAPQEGLAASSVAKITDIVTSQTDYKATDLHIIEVK